LWNFAPKVVKRLAQERHAPGKFLNVLKRKTNEKLIVLDAERCVDTLRVGTLITMLLGFEIKGKLSTGGGRLRLKCATACSAPTRSGRTPVCLLETTERSFKIAGGQLRKVFLI
jgi:hypothetical protein